jgi:hypothetical protein
VAAGTKGNALGHDGAEYKCSYRASSGMPIS